MDLFSYFGEGRHLSKEIQEKLSSIFQQVHFSKSEIVLQPDNFNRKLYFIECGLARTFYFKGGKEITHFFFREDSFYTPIECTFYNHNSPYGFEFLTPSDVRVAYFSELDELMKEHPELERFTRKILVDFLKLASERLYSLQFQSAQERYKDLITTYPDILLQAPLGHVASYLGITQQTLSVIRGQK